MLVISSLPSIYISLYTNSRTYPVPTLRARDYTEGPRGAEPILWRMMET